MAGENGNEQVAVVEKAPDSKPEPIQEEQVPISKVNRLTSALQSQTAAEAARARAAEERASAIEAERNELAAKIQALEDDLKLAHRAKEGPNGEMEAEVEVVKRLNKQRAEAEETKSKLRRANEALERATERERKATARELALTTGAKEDDLLKHKDIHEMTAAALKFQVEALTAQLTGKEPPKPAPKKAGEFDSGQPSTSGGDEEFLKRYGRGEERGPAANKRAAELNKKLGYL